MDDRFSRVVVRNTSDAAQRHNIHIAVHPFSCQQLHMMSARGIYGFSGDRPELADYQKRLADRLWDKIPGLSHLFFGNGHITIQHYGAFDDGDIYAAAVAIITPVLEENLWLDNLIREDEGGA